MGSQPLEPLVGSSVWHALRWVLRSLRRYRVEGASMWPTIPPRRSVLVDLTAYRDAEPRAGEIVLMRHPKRDELVVVKRVTATGDGTVLVHGDNPHESSDSRDFGPVPVDHVLGRVECLFGSAATPRS